MVSCGSRSGDSPGSVKGDVDGRHLRAATAALAVAAAILSGVTAARSQEQEPVNRQSILYFYTFTGGTDGAAKHSPSQSSSYRHEVLQHDESQVCESHDTQCCESFNPVWQIDKDALHGNLDSGLQRLSTRLRQKRGVEGFRRPNQRPTRTQFSIADLRPGILNRSS